MGFHQRETQVFNGDHTRVTMRIKRLIWQTQKQLGIEGGWFSLIPKMRGRRQSPRGISGFEIGRSPCRVDIAYPTIYLTAVIKVL